MVGITVFFLLVATGCYASSNDEVGLRLALRCNFQNAHFTITLWEWDRLSPDDSLSKREIWISDSDEYTAFVDFHETIDGDEAFSSQYTFYVMIDHNCGSTNKAKVWLKPACEEGETCLRYYVIDLYKLDGVHTIETTTSSLYWSEYTRVESAKKERMKMEEERKERERIQMDKEMNEDEDEEYSDFKEDLIKESRKSFRRPNYPLGKKI